MFAFGLGTTAVLVAAAYGSGALLNRWAARHPKSFISLDDADHLLMRETDSRYVGSVIGAWAERYL
jgi:hypothetical protein